MKYHWCFDPINSNCSTKQSIIQTSFHNRHTITTPTMMKSSMILSFSKFAFLVVLIASTTTTAIAPTSSTTESSSLRGGNGVSTSRDGNTRTVPICRQWRMLEVVDVVGANYIVRYGQPVGSYEGKDNVDEHPLPNSRKTTMTAAAPLETPSTRPTSR